MPEFLFVHGLEGSVIILFILIVLNVSSPNKLEYVLVSRNDAVCVATGSEFCLDVLYGTC